MKISYCNSGKLQCPYNLQECIVNDTAPYSSCSGCTHNTTKPFGPNEIERLNFATESGGVGVGFYAGEQKIPLALVPPHWLGGVTILPDFGIKFEHVFEDHAQFAAKAFPLSTPESSLVHLKCEADEVLAELNFDYSTRERLLIEYADMMLCIISSATGRGITSSELVEAMHKKVQINKGRKWKYNGDGTYSHIKE